MELTQRGCGLGLRGCRVRKSLRLFFAISCLLFLAGCVTINTSPQKAGSNFKPAIPSIQALSGIYHRVEKGQTLWRISRLYGIDLDDIVRINNISDTTQLRAGQSIFIPHVSRQQSAGQTKQAIAEDFIWPVRGKILSNFGEKSGNVLNKGINMRMLANSDVLASRSGTVVFANDKLRGYGRTIIIEHSDGFMTIYSLLSEILVRPGDYINQGAPIAKAVSGLIHFEIRKGCIPQNPYYYLSTFAS